ncbi:MAG TPA: hypothetical protein VGQ44_21860 [Gemmatimonadaceae bacterium]|nr:hypothetical protein [Gemmatimonadaceae bacterium]
MAPAVGVPLNGFRIKFEHEFKRHAPTHHVTRRDVERVLRFPRWVNDLTTTDRGTALFETVGVWVAAPMSLPRHDPSSLLVITRDRRGDRWVHDAWRVYHSDVDLRAARSAYDVLSAFLARYGLEVQLGNASRRLFLPCRVPMAATANAAPRVLGALSRPETRRLEIVRLVPERAEIEVTVAFAVDERSLRADIARHPCMAMQAG